MRPVLLPAALISLVLSGLACRAPAASAAQAPEWRPADSPLQTRWTARVKPQGARAEYPRPLLRRRDWVSLNGLWEFAFDDENTGTKSGWHSGKTLPEQILVPFTFESALSGIGKGKEIHERVWYRRHLNIPPGWSGQRVLLHFNACDWQTTAWLNGKELGTHRGGYDPFSWEITPHLRASGPQELVVAVYDPADPAKGAYQPKGKQLGSEGIWYTRTTGIWQTVWLEPVHRTSIDVKRIVTKVDPETRKGEASVEYRLRGDRAATLKMMLRRGGKELAAAAIQLPPGTREGRLSLAAGDLDLWSPESPHLYDLRFEVEEGGHRVDEIESYCAFREYGVRDGRLTLNGKPYFLRGVLDQGYWPDGIMTAPSDEALRFDVEMTKRMGFNMSRKHVKVEDPRWYYWCDRLGLAVWQDMPSSHNLSGPEAKQNFTQEWRAAMEATRSYPSVLHWIPFNENWGDPGEYQDQIVRLTHQLDPSRPVTDASGWTQRELTDVIDIHDYSNDLLRHGVENPVKPKVVGEYGGVALPVPGHTWSEGWGYQSAKDVEGLLRRIALQTSQLHAASNLSGFVYTQISDVEQELNGLMTYDRRPKADPRKIADIMTGRQSYDFLTGFVKRWSVLGPIPSGTTLTTARDDEPARRQLERAIETLESPHLLRDTEIHDGGITIDGRRYNWLHIATDSRQLDLQHTLGPDIDNAVAYVVAEVEAPKEMDATLLLGSDDAARIWLNGEEIGRVVRVRGVAPDSDDFPVRLKEGRNLLVIKVAQGVGGWGVTARFAGPGGLMLPQPAPE